MMMHPVAIKRFKPVEILVFDPDKPIKYQNPIPREIVETEDDVVRLGQLLYEAEMKAWEGRNSAEIIETVIDGAVDDLMDVAQYLETLKGAKPARDAHQKIMELIVRMKSPLVSCIMQSFQALYIKGGMKEVRKAIGRITHMQEGGEG